MIISSIPAKCKRSYNCVRYCPAKAIRVKEGRAEIIEKRCILCGTCLKVCSQNTKKVERHIPTVKRYLFNKKPTYACLDPTFVTLYPDCHPRQVVAAVKELGFDYVFESSFGAEMVSAWYRDYINKNPNKTIISSICPAIVYLIEKHYPELVDMLAPTISPMIAMGRLIRSEFNSSAHIVSIGPCIAQKQEMKDPDVKDVIDAVLTFNELKDMLREQNIDPCSLPEGSFDGPRPGLARIFPLSGGLIKSALPDSHFLETDYIVVSGKDKVLEILKEKQQGIVFGKFLDIRFCDGCINGPAIDSHLTIVARQEQVARYTKDQYEPGRIEHELAQYRHIDLGRTFSSKQTVLPVPTEKDIHRVLSKLGKTEPADEQYCGACGYQSCRQMAIAVYQGLAEMEMCFPYVMSQLEKSNKELSLSYMKLEESHQALESANDKLEQAQRQAIQSEKLASMGQLAASVAHEINNPLSGVLTYIKLMRRQLSHLQDRRDIHKRFEDYLSVMDIETQRCGNIAMKLLEFAREREPQKKPANINDVLEKALELLEHELLLDEIEIIKELKQSPPVICDAPQLQQAFMNIILNAGQAMQKGGQLTLTSEFISNENCTQIKITDTGPGICPEHLNKIFDPFFTTKKSGTGLGLSVVYGIITGHNGSIMIESEQEKGTTFNITLPADAREQG